MNKPCQPRSQNSFPKKKTGGKKPEYGSFKANWFDNVMWFPGFTGEKRNEKAHCIICRNMYALNQLTISQKTKNLLLPPPGMAMGKMLLDPFSNTTEVYVTDNSL